MTPQDLSGQKFGKWTVIKMLQKRDKKGYTQFWCRCECGKTSIVRSTNLRNGHSTQCDLCRRKQHRERLGINTPPAPLLCPEDYIF